MYDSHLPVFEGQLCDILVPVITRIQCFVSGQQSMSYSLHTDKQLGGKI